MAINLEKLNQRAAALRETRNPDELEKDNARLKEELLILKRRLEGVQSELETSTETRMSLGRELGATNTELQRLKDERPDDTNTGEIEARASTDQISTLEKQLQGTMEEIRQNREFIPLIRDLLRAKTSPVEIIAFIENYLSHSSAADDVK